MLGSLPDRELCHLSHSDLGARVGKAQDRVDVVEITAQIRVIPRLSDWKVILKLATFYSGKSASRRDDSPEKSSALREWRR